MSYKIRVRKEAAARIHVTHWSESMGRWVMANLKGVLSLIGVFVVVGLVLFAFNAMTSNEEGKASILETEASILLHDPMPLPEPIEEGEDPPEILTQTERYQKSADLYGEILEKYPNTVSAMVAQYESGNVYFELEAFDQAEEHYRDFIRMYPEKKELISIVQLKLGYLQQRKGESQAARDFFRTLYESESARNRDQAGFELARSLETSGKEEEARKIYEKISEDFALSPWGTEARARFTLLNPSSETESSSGEKTSNEAVEEEPAPESGPITE